MTLNQSTANGVNVKTFVRIKPKETLIMTKALIKPVYIDKSKNPKLEYSFVTDIIYLGHPLTKGTVNNRMIDE